MTYRHEAVLCSELLEVFLPMSRGIMVDGTVGGGGFSSAFMERAGKEVQLVAFDWDPAAIEAATRALSKFSPRVRFFRRNFAEMANELETARVGKVSGIVLDLGLSSSLLEGERGFSFRKEGPLDMRMDPDGIMTARALLEEASVESLQEILRRFGNVQGAGKLASALKEASLSGRLLTTLDLAGVVRQVFPSAGWKLLSRVFQSLRIAVNQELANLERFLGSGPQLLEKGGKLAIVSFHSLEDRLVKTKFRELTARGEFKLGTKKPITPTADEIKANPKSRSAKMRWIERVTP